MTTLYFDCSSGISGDMTVGTLISLGVPREYIADNLKLLNLDGYELNVFTAERYSISAIKFDVLLQENDASRDHGGHDHSHRHMSDIRCLIEKSDLNANVKTVSLGIFEVLVQAEAKIHGVEPDEVGLHEVGAVDSIIDIVSVAICIDYLKPDRIVFSPLSEGRGRIRTAHGMLPIPVPATLEIISKCRAVISFTDVNGEMITPTGAAIAAYLGDTIGAVCPAGVVQSTGYGAGTRDFGFPNVLRSMLIHTTEQSGDKVLELRSSIDDSTGEQLAYAMVKLFELGVLDAYYTPIHMKKGRPAVELTVLCCPDDEDKVTNAIFRHTSTIGIRKTITDRIVMERSVKTIDTRYGKIELKVCTFGDIERSYMEFESAKKAAELAGVSIYDIAHELHKHNDI